MTETETVPAAVATVEDIQRGWHQLTLRVDQLEAERSALEKENKALRTLLERVIEHRQKSHAELVLLLAGLASKLTISDVGATVTRLIEHNKHVNEVLAALAKGKMEADIPQPLILQTMDQRKRELQAALKPAVEDLIRLEVPLDCDLLRSLTTQPEQFFSPAVTRANRCFVKGLLPRDRILREFGEAALPFFFDMTTDLKLNPRPKPEEIVYAFKGDAPALLQQDTTLPPEKRQALLALYHKVQRSKAPTDEARMQRNAFHRLSYLLELLHYYENQNTEAPDVTFAQRLPNLIEQLVVAGPNEPLEEKLLVQAEHLLAFIVNPDHRLMVINNLGKNGATARTLGFVLKLRTEKLPDLNDVLTELVRHLIPSAPQKPPTAQALAAILRLMPAERQRSVALSIMVCDRLRKEEAESLGKAIGKELGLTNLEVPVKTAENIPPEVERQMAWDKIKEMVTSRADPAAIAAAIRNRLRAKYDADELKLSWMTLIEAEAMAFIRIFCQLPYLPDGSTDPIARPVMQTYLTRLVHEKYAAAHAKVVTSLRNLHKANPNSPTLVNFMALAKWVEPDVSSRLSADIGMALAA